MGFGDVDKSWIVNSITEYIEEQLQSESSALSLDQVANRIGYSKFYLNRVFQEVTQTTIHQYIYERRLSEAGRKLVQTDKPIIDIAYEAGYQSQQAFTNAFSNRYLCAPMKYRIDQQHSPIRTPFQGQSAFALRACGRMAVAA